MTDSPTVNAPISFIGLGRMGGPMVARLIAAGHPVHVFDTDPDVLAAAAEQGAVPLASPATAAANEITILMLPSSDIVESVVLDGGLLERATSGALIIDMGSSEPGRTRSLAAICEARQVTLIDAPVSGGVKGAREGTLTIMVGGHSAAVSHAAPILSVMGSNVRHAGGVGSGHAIKALNNLLSATHLLATAEAMTAADRFGLDPAVALEIINDSSGRSGSTQAKWPNFVLTDTFDSGFALDLMLKDMRIAVGLARGTETECSLAETAVELWGRAATDLRTDADHTEIARWVKTLNLSTGADSDG